MRNALIALPSFVGLVTLAAATFGCSAPDPGAYVPSARAHASTGGVQSGGGESSDPTSTSSSGDNGSPPPPSPTFDAGHGGSNGGGATSSDAGAPTTSHDAGAPPSNGASNPTGCTCGCDDPCLTAIIETCNNFPNIPGCDQAPTDCTCATDCNGQTGSNAAQCATEFNGN